MNKDLEFLQGSWNVATLEVDGQATPAQMLSAARIVIENDRFISSGMGAVYEGTVTLRPSTRPPQIDLKFDRGPEKGNTNPGIYQLDGDAWKLCLATHGHGRPRSFATRPGAGLALETLVRGKQQQNAAAAPEVTGPATEFEGEWTMLSGVMDGKAMDASLLKWVKRTTRGNRTTVTAGPQVMLDVEFTFDPSPSPATIEYRNKAGRQKGIYKLEGDILTVCVAPPGAPRPNEFTSTRGDNRTLTVWGRRSSRLPS